MASWKEKGVVPDSDNEDDLESQTSASQDEVFHNQRINEINDAEGTNESKSSRNEDETSKQASRHNEDTAPRFEHNSDRIIRTSNQRNPGSPKSLSNVTFPLSSPDSPKFFKFPPSFWTLDGGDSYTEPRSESRATRTQSPHRDQVTTFSMEDEVSTSYVRIISPKSSPLSSPPLSELSSISKDPFETVVHTEHSDNRESYSPALEDYGAHTSIARRHLRHRNPIQLHPYILEQEKYRKILKGRGIAPTRITQEREKQKQHPKPRITNSQEEQDSQESCFYDHAAQADPEMVDSRMDFAWDPVSSSPQMTAQSEGEIESQSEGEDQHHVARDDEEFPDIEDLLRRRPEQPQKLGRSQGSNSYSTKVSRRQLSKLPDESKKRPQSKDKGLLDIPASPPKTSSPLPAILSSSTKQLFAATSSSPTEVTPSWLVEDDYAQEHPVELPTPATSAMKPDSELHFLDSDLESNDPFDDIGGTGTTAFVSDQSDQIREVGRAIRGVLPASHLRLDKQRKNHRRVASPSFRASRSLSPVQPVRKGVARPTVLKDIQNLGSNSVRVSSLPELSEDEDEECPVSNFALGDDLGSDPNSFDQSRIGFAEEVDNIDAMFPTRKRQLNLRDIRPRKKRQSWSNSIPHGVDDPFIRQPKITEHLERQRKHGAPKKETWGQKETRVKKHGISDRRLRAPTAPMLSILDVLDTMNKPSIPLFLKIATRTVKLRKDQGRQNPSRKFIRLANREDTQDVQAVFQDWNEGRLRPKKLEFPRNVPGIIPRAPLKELEDNQQTTFRSPVKKVFSKARAGRSTLSQKLVISKRSQRPIIDFLKAHEPSVLGSVLDSRSSFKASNRSHRSHKWPQYEAPLARPAQLELTEEDNVSPHPAASFRQTKKVLDTLYKASRKRRIPTSNIQLERFLADEGDVHQSVEASTVVDIGNDNPKILNTQSVRHIPRRKKRIPQRIDAGAARFCQPSNPLVLDNLAQPSHAEGKGSKLLGLGKFGATYPQHFNVFPLPSGVFFNKKTFIGSGRLARVLRGTAFHNEEPSEPRKPLRLGNNEIQWRSWNEKVSSELGVCFDWIFDQLVIRSSPPSSTDSVDVLVALNSVVEYAATYFNSNQSNTVENFLSRMQEVLQEFFVRLDGTNVMTEQLQSRRAIELLQTCVLLVLQLLKISRAYLSQSSLHFSFEDLLKKAAGLCVRLLLREGLDGIRKLYDDLQYLSVREYGISQDCYQAQAWVVTIKALEDAAIPRCSFWDLANSQLINAEIKTVEDARIMERLWFSLFSLLPLFEFDEFGVLVPGLRYRISSENWSLPQHLLKRVFTLYGSNPRQSASFNCYCSAIVSRCHCLVVEWGWWRCTSVIGTIFDFFASNNLAHLRNEEVFSSPRFLEELHTEPDLAVEAEDRCFHIFLKLVALGIKKLREADDIKGVRNLVARLLPNHDRHYLKDEAIHQRELASLRNHHDLLCTIYFAAPHGQRPSPAMIQALVIPEQSHKAASLINIRAWQYLTRFVVTAPSTFETFEPLLNWQRKMFDALLRQFLSIESEVRQQAKSVADVSMETISESSIWDTIHANQQSTVSTVFVFLNALATSMREASSPQVAQLMFDPDLVARSFSMMSRAARCRPSEAELILEASVDIVSAYLGQISKRNNMIDNVDDDDSQEALEMMNAAKCLDLKEMVEKFFPILPELVLLLKNVLRGISHQPKILEQLVHAWAQIISHLTAKDTGDMEPDQFFNNGPYNIFEARDHYRIASEYWGLFLVHLITFRAYENLSSIGIEPLEEWMKYLALPPNASPFATQLTQAMKTKNCLFQHYNAPPSGLINLKSRGKLINDVIQNYAVVLSTGTGRIAQFKRSSFAKCLESLMQTMKRSLESLESETSDHLEYVSFVQLVIEAIKAEASHLQTIDQYFLKSSSQYWPRQQDRKLVFPSIIAYCRELNGDNSRKAHFQLFYYLFNGYRQSLRENDLQQFTHNVQRALKSRQFLEYMIRTFLTALLRVGNELIEGWALIVGFLPAVAARINKILWKKNTESIPMLSMAKDLLRLIAAHASNRPTRCSESATPDPFLNTLLQFWLNINLAMTTYCIGTADMKEIDEFQSLFDAILRKIGQSKKFESNISNYQYQPKDNVLVDKFVQEAKQELASHWVLTAGAEDCEVALTTNDRNGELICFSLKCPSRQDIMKLWSQRLPEPIGGAFSSLL